MAKAKAPAIGIDLGTTYSRVGIFQHGEVEIIANDQGNSNTPSYVAFMDDERLIGDAAKNQVAMNPTNTVFKVQRLIGDAAKNQVDMNPTKTVFDTKRLIGRRFEDQKVQGDIEHWPFRVISDGRTPKIQVDCNLSTFTYLPEEISSMVLLKMKETAEAYVGMPITDAVITVPAYFNNLQRQATKDAGLLSGLNVLRIINEPTAAFIAYSFDKKLGAERNVLIFDLGGGTFDVSILNTEDGIFQVRSTSGDTHLGGEDFDTRMVTHFIQEFKHKHKKDISDNKIAVRRLRTACERAKRTLSSSIQANVEIDSLYEGIDFYTSITRARFEELCADLFTRTVDIVEMMLKDANIDRSSVHDIVLVGGSTLIPKVKMLLEIFFNGRELNKSFIPDDAVAYGAAVLAACLHGDKSKAVKDLFDITPLSLGVYVLGETIQIFPRNTAFPCFTDVLITLPENQPEIEILLFEGDEEMIANNRFIGWCTLREIPPAPNGSPEVKLTFGIDDNGIMNHVSAVEMITGDEDKITITKGWLNREDIDKFSSLRSYVYSLAQLVREHKLEGNVSELDVEIFEEMCVNILDWKDHNHFATKEEFITKQYELFIGTRDMLDIHKTTRAFDMLDWDM